MDLIVLSGTRRQDLRVVVLPGGRIEWTYPDFLLDLNCREYGSYGQMDSSFAAQGC
jgi:hypothetical protein